MSDIKLPELPTLYAWNTDGMVRELLYAYAREAVELNRRDAEKLIDQCREALKEVLRTDFIEDPINYDLPIAAMAAINQWKERG